MGRGGKKKGKKDTEGLGLGDLTLEDTGPSTSEMPKAPEAAKVKEEPTPKDEAEDEGGLNIGFVKKKNKKKKEATPPAQPMQTSDPHTSQSVQKSASLPQQQKPQGVSIPTQHPQSAGRGRGAPGAGRGWTVAGQPQPVGRGRAAAPAWAAPIATPGHGDDSVAKPSAPAQVEARASTSRPVQQEPVKQAQGPMQFGRPTSTLCRFQIPHKIRSRVGVPSDPIKVLTNYLPMNVKPLIIHRYDVAITPDRPKKLMPKVFQAVKALHFRKDLLAFDMMKNCYALKPLVKENEVFNTDVQIKDDNGTLCKFEFALKTTGTVDLGSLFRYMKDGTALCPPTEAVHCIDVILRQGALENYVKASRQYFTRPRNPIDLGDGLEMWTGLFQSAIFTSRPFINIDVAHKGFPKCQPLLDTYRNDFRLDVNNPLERQRKIECELFRKFIHGLHVNAMIGDHKTGYKKREFICNSLVAPANELKFTLTDAAGRNELITVEQYFSKIKGQRLKYPYMNCVWVGPRNKQIYYPIELLEVTYGQALNRQLNDRQLPKMVREAATPPSDRKRKIEEVIKDMKYSSNEYFREFGLEISTKFYEVDAKILRAPILNVGEGTVIPRRGVWQAKRLLRPSALQSWGFIVVEADPNRLNCHNIIQMIQRVGKQMGMSVQEPSLTNFNIRATELHSTFRKAVDNKITLLFVIVSSWAQNLYQKVKKMAELEVGILTQCIKDNTAERRMNEQTIRNILLKVNSKLMGVNQTLENRCVPPCLKDGGVMVVGADVTHPSPDQTDIPSIAAVTASFDTKCFQYNIELSIQTPKKEMIVEFENMMVEHLKVYKNHQNALPRKIYIFRDGVSEGQFAQVMNSELVAVYKAYERLAGANAKPEILFLLVQKRHHTRFFLGESNAQNVEPGTVVDKDIVHNSEMDFYMVSHQAIKGTARPTRYYGVRNDGKIPIEEVEQLTYYLCHLFSRCTRSVSYPAPTYYAHLACTRAKNLTFGTKFNDKDLQIKPQRLQVLSRMLDFSRMFFV
ncbi:protein argonaute-2-like [Zerene cesonia]|uniref:protein argonaute-2-like n=1 Tax=Zerene cesonia TaxID=33412 RepID=UPI0018E585F4|nr:protein argonaute-2-like [Zerene cesonia]